MREVRENGVSDGDSCKQWHAIYPWILQSTSYWRNQVHYYVCVMPTELFSVAEGSRYDKY